MAAALDARQESLTYLRNFRKDGSKFNNLLFMTPITLESSATGTHLCLPYLSFTHPYPLLSPLPPPTLSHAQPRPPPPRTPSLPAPTQTVTPLIPCTP